MTRSSELYRRALELLPGGVNSPVRAMRAIGRDPLFLERGSGSRVWDVDGNEYVDWVSSWGPLILGHAHPDVIAAVSAAASEGTTFGAPTEGEVELAAVVAAAVPSVEMMRMTSSGTEATMSALRLARAATGREKVLKFAGAYHGHVDGLLAEAGSGLATQGIPASPGVPEAAAAATVIVPWNEPDAVRAAVAQHAFAAIIAEPVPANMGVVPPVPGFLEVLRSLADDNGALLIFDEVITGFRVGRGGAQERYAVTPDLTIMGKVIGGGLPAAGYGGSRALMERIAPAGDVYQAGTLSGNPLAVAAALATLQRLDARAYHRLEAVTDALATGLQQAAADAGVPLVVQSVPGLLTPFFSDRAVGSYAIAAACDLEAYGAWCRALLDRGVYPPPSQFEAWFPSLAHSDDDIERTVAAASEAFGERMTGTVADALRAHGGTLAEHVQDGTDGERLELSGPRTEGHEQEYGLLLEMIREGSRLHYGTPLLVSTDDPDLRLLLGDQLYALGLARLAALGDIDAVAELADVISLVAQAHAAGDGELADAVWEAGATAIGWGASEQHRAAKALARAGDGRARDALRAAAQAGRS